MEVALKIKMEIKGTVVDIVLTHYGKPYLRTQLWVEVEGFPELRRAIHPYNVMQGLLALKAEVEGTEVPIMTV